MEYAKFEHSVNPLYSYSETSDKGPSEKRAAALERTVSNVSLPIAINTFLDLREEDNLSTVDKMAGPKVSFI